jgi:phosphatidylserine/phosphatidylglycerophosphate/cardiolipin synthase-like enzyme
MMKNQRPKTAHQGIPEKDFKRLVTLSDKLRHAIHILYYLMDNNRERSFVAALLSAENIDMVAKITHEKRETDILFEIDPEKNLYALLCQGTEVDGGYYFIRRLVERIQEDGGTDVYCGEISVRNTRHPTDEILFRLLNLYTHAKSEKADGEIKFHALV